MSSRPTLLGSCASAATAAEARFRINGPAPKPRATRVVALDDEAHEVVRPFIDEPWRGVRFLRYRPTGAEHDLLDDLVLSTEDGDSAPLSEELADADFMLMVATTGDGAAAASAIGTACSVRGIMTAALILGTSGSADAAVTALRPYARVLLVSRDGADVAEMLSAVGA
jgi:hypothetical protein